MKFKKNKFVVGSIIVFFVIIGMGAFFFLGKTLIQTFLPDSKPQPVEPITKDAPIVSCKPGDSACKQKNEKVVANKLTGSAVEYAKHQCDGPRACPTPDPTTADEAISSIRISAKDPSLELVRITGINVSGIIYYCAADNRCWSYDTKEKKIAGFLDGEKME